MSPNKFQGTRGRRSVNFDSKSIKDGLEDIYKNINNNQNKDDNEEQQQQNAVGSPFYVNSMTTESIINSNSGDLVSTRYVF